MGQNQIEMALGKGRSGEFVSDAIGRQKNVIRIAEVNTADLIVYEDGADFRECETSLRSPC